MNTLLIALSSAIISVSELPSFEDLNLLNFDVCQIEVPVEVETTETDHVVLEAHLGLKDEGPVKVTVYPSFSISISVEL